MPLIKYQLVNKLLLMMQVFLLMIFIQTSPQYIPHNLKVQGDRTTQI